MPSFTLPITQGELRVNVLVGIPEALAAFLVNNNQPRPSPIQGRALIDTGADCTFVSSAILKQLPISSLLPIPNTTTVGSAPVDVYPISLSIIDPFHSQEVGLQPTLFVGEWTNPPIHVDVILGMDVLLKGKLALDGPAGTFTLDYPP